MHTADLILYLAALICFILAALGIPSRVNLIAIGLACWVAVPLIATLNTAG